MANTSPDSTLPAQRLNKAALQAILARANNGDQTALDEIESLSPADAAYIGMQPEWINFCYGIMVKGVAGEKITRNQRSCAAWFVRVVQAQGEKKSKEKSGKVPLNAEIVDASEGDE